MSAAEKIRHLKLVLGEEHKFLQKEFWPLPGTIPSLSPGIPKGAIIELLGSAKVEWLIAFLKSNPEFKIFWAEREQSVLPTALYQRGLNLENITFGLFGEDMMQPLRRIIQSQSFEIVIAPQIFDEIKTLKALQLFTEKANTSLFLLSNKTASTAWPISLQLEVHTSEKNHLHVDVIKQKHSMTAGHIN